MKPVQIQLLRRISSIAFAIAFLMAIVLFAGVGRSYVSLITAKYIFISSGAIALLLNLLTFQGGKQNPLYNFIYWIGSLVLFAGLLFFLFRWPYGFYIIVAGLGITGISFFIPTEKPTTQQKNEQLLDDF